MVSTATVDGANPDAPDLGTFAALGMLIHDLARTKASDEVYTAVAEHLPEVVAADRASIALFDEDKHSVNLVALEGTGFDDSSMGLGTDNLAITKVVREGLPMSSLVDGDSAHEDHKRLAEDGLSAVLNVPVFRRGEAYGTINIAKVDPRPLLRVRPEPVGAGR